MSHKGKNSASSAKGKKPAKSGAESKSEDVLQAVIIADSFQDRFKPLTLEKPRCLLPLANTPLIEYTLEFLAMNGVQEVYIYCGSHTDQVEDYIGSSRWVSSSRLSPFSVLQFVRVSDARSIGDVLRDLDKRSLVDGDFLLVHGDLVSNIMLDGALEAHRKRRETSSANIMTMILHSGGNQPHRTKTNGITPVFVVDTKTQRCLHYDEMNPLQSDRYLSLDPAIADELSTEFEVRSDLIDAQIDICTAEVLALWSESFDYELPRRNFLHGVLKDWELNGKMIYAEIFEEGYAARASNLQMYDAISRDILGRWTFPFIPENNLVPGHTYKKHINGVTLESGTLHAPDAKLRNSIIGDNTVIGSGSRVSNSVIGRNCRIGVNVNLENSFVWDDAIIEDGAIVTNSIVADAAVVGKGVSLPVGSLVSFGVHIGDNASLSTAAILSTLTADGEAVTKDTDLLGENTNAAPFFDPEDDEIDDEDPARLQKSLLYSLAEFNISVSSVSTLNSDVLSDDEDNHFLSADAAQSSRSRLSSFASDDSAGKMSFHTDAVHGLVDALRADSGDFDSAKLEFMGLRLANDASDAMMRKAVATAFARRAVELLTPEHGGLEPSKAAEKALTARKGATKFINEVGVGGGETEQVEFILALQRALQHAGKGPEQSKTGILLAALLQQLYALDILEEEGIIAWWEDDRAVEGETMTNIKEKCRVLVEWLENAEEEDDDDDDDSD
ncbi:putative translation initiation factor eIF-2B subunit epsilon [Cladobotryum mycophilum]|uniref:Mannose-1-phosphate guanyltransferase n=1 Tax=Cladobotryum mycophilum TaxID=491253 RepID=A0ABR0SU82_9HYPO